MASNRFDSEEDALEAKGQTKSQKLENPQTATLLGRRLPIHPFAKLEDGSSQQQIQEEDERKEHEHHRDDNRIARNEINHTGRSTGDVKTVSPAAETVVVVPLTVACYSSQ